MSLKEIAERTGVSISTVSRVLNNSQGSCVSAPVRERVLAAARECCYQPNLNARNLKKSACVQKQSLITIIMAREDVSQTDSFFSHCLNDLSAELLRSGFCLHSVDYLKEGAGRISEADGYIVLGKCRQELLQILKKRTANLVGVWRNPSVLPVDQVFSSGKKAVFLAMNYLTELGHRRIAYIGDCSYENRFIGYTEALTEHRLPLIYSLVFDVCQDREDGRRAMERLLDTGGATAVLCASDEIALGAMEALKRARRARDSVPVSVVSIDDIPAASKANLTTVHIPRREMAHLAVQLLADRFAGGHEECVNLELPCRLIERDSCFLSV